MKLTQSSLLLRQLTGNQWFHYAPLCNKSRRKEQQKHYNFKENVNSNYKNKFLLQFAAGLSSVGLGIGIYKFYKAESGPLLASEHIAGARIGSLPTFSVKEIAKHLSRETGVWVIYKNGVYDITNFLDKHPGGDKIMMAAGSSVEPFWMMYGVHKQDHILELMEQYRIGNIDENEADDFLEDAHDPYSKDPRRHSALRPCSLKPFNAEPPPEILVDSFITPQEIFYVRNHLPVPEVDLKDYELEISGLGVKTKAFKLDDLKKLPKHTITAAVQCAGNRRSEMSKVKPVKGLNWGHAVIGNASWSGVKLRDLLLHLGLSEDSGAHHVQFEGLDCDPSGSPYGASIPIEKALDPRGDVLLAYEMNGKPLPRDHGFPLRAIVPGVVGARNVKWLNRIIVTKEESPSHWQQNDYKGFSPSTDWDTVDFSKSPSIQELPVTSAICSPSPGENVKLNKDGTVTVKGYAWSGGGRKIVRVDLTADGGKTWSTASFTDQDPAERPLHWAWTLWTAQLPVPPKSSSVEVWVKAVDSSYNTQPESFSNIWNLRGVLSNAYHRVKINIVQN